MLTFILTLRTEMLLFIFDPGVPRHDVIYKTLLFITLMCAFCVIGYNEHDAEGLPTSMFMFDLDRS